MDLTDEELVFTRLQKGLYELKDLEELEKIFKNKPMFLNEIYKQMANKLNEV